MNQAAFDTSPAVIPLGEIPEHVGSLVSVKARVKWCQIPTDGPAVYALNSSGSIRFEVAPEDQSAFTPAQLRTFCGSVQLHGVVNREQFRYVIAVITPDQVTVARPQ